MSATGTDPRTAPRVFAGGARTIPAALRHWASTSPGRPALSHGETSLTFAELADEVDSVASALAARGLERGDRVVLVGANSIEWAVCYLAVLRAGGVVAPSNNRITPQQMLGQCELLEARLVLHDAEHVELAHGAAGAGRLVLDFAGLVGQGASPSEVREGWPDPEHVALISFTSGTTGHPKGATLTHEAVFRGSAVFAEVLDSDESSSTLVLVPLFHNTGFIDQLGHMLVVGGRTNILTRYRSAAAVAELRRRPVSFITAVPSILRLLMVAEDSDIAFASASATTVLFGGSPMPEAWTREFLARWPHLRLVHGYGLTEFTSACSFLPADLVADKGESVGRPAPGVELRVADDDGRICDAFQVGEVQVSGPTCMTGYWRQPELTRAIFDGRWLRTGDLGHVDADGLLWLSGRVDDVINRGGEKVLPSFVESCIAQRPEISDVSVFGVDDPVLQRRVGAAVELRDGADFDEAAARTFLATLLPDYAIPEFWIVSAALPRTASGKVDRRAVAADFSPARTASQEDS